MVDKLVTDAEAEQAPEQAADLLAGRVQSR